LVGSLRVDIRLTEEQQLLRQAVREFAEAELRPHVMVWDEAQAFSMDLLPKLAGLGLMGIQVPESLGGSGMSAVAYCVCIEELARVDPSIALSVAAHNGLLRGAPECLRVRDAETRISAAPDGRPASGRVGADRSQLRQRCRVDADGCRARGRLLGPERQQAIHHGTAASAARSS
jgi:alkylation response protein AidB-like acyl-CoA dehydrogenase